MSVANFVPKNKRIETDESVKRNDVSGIQPIHQYLDYLIVCLKHLIIYFQQILLKYVFTLLILFTCKKLSCVAESIFFLFLNGGEMKNTEV